MLNSGAANSRKVKGTIRVNFEILSRGRDFAKEFFRYIDKVFVKKINIMVNDVCTRFEKLIDYIPDSFGIGVVEAFRDKILFGSCYTMLNCMF